jgi:hypothetical protein
MHKWLYRLIVLLGCTQTVWLVAQTCKPVIPPADLKGVRPTEIVPPGTHENCNFLQFAWQDFLAMNWPPLPTDPGNTHGIARGLPDQSKVIGQSDNGDNRTVWEQDQPNWYLFWPRNPPPPASDGQSFVAWNRHAWLPAACGPLADKLPLGSEPPRILSSLSKFDGMPGLLQAQSSLPLIDQDGYYARYEILMDYPAFNYINANKFYLLDNVKAFAQKGQPFVFPVQDGNQAGATFIKAAWKTLSEQEINSRRYHTAQAFLYTPAASNIEPTCVGPVTVGLVGIHIVQKTKDLPKWMWATFEQVDTTPADPSNLPPDDPPGGWGFFKRGSSLPSNQKPKCPDGVSTPEKCDFQPTSSHMGQNPNDKTGGPTQAVRSNPIPKSLNQPDLGQLNQAVQDALRQINPKSVWQFYQLVEAQWQNGPTTFFPTKVANLTMETYTQSISCATCHRAAKAPDSDPQVPSDMMFELGLAWQDGALPASRVSASAHATPTSKKGGTK